MPDRAAADRTAKLLLWFLREPLRYRTEVRRRDAPPLAGDVVFKLALGRGVEFSDPAVRGESAATLREAAAAYVRQVLFRPDATPYQILGLPPGASGEAIKDHFRLLMQLVHPDRQDARAPWPDAFAARANRAYSILRKPESRATLDREESERAARMHATQRRAEAAAATPSARGAARAVARRPLPPAVLPEWVTAGVGGFVRGHPALTAFVALLGGAALVIGMVAWERPAESLTRDARMPAMPVPHARDAANATANASGPDVAAATVVGGSQATVAAQALAANARMVPEMRTAVPAPVVSGADARMPAHDASQAPDASTKAPGTIATDAGAVPPPVESSPVPPRVAPPVAARADASSGGLEPGAPAATPKPLTMAEIDALSLALVDSYDRGRIDAFAALFDAAAETNFHQGRAAIRSEYDELFRLSSSRRMQLRELDWRRVGERAYAKGEIQVLVSWRDGREVDQRVAVDIEVARRDGRVVITRLAHQPSAR